MNLFGLNITRAFKPTVTKSAGDLTLSDAARAWLRGEDSTPAAPILSNAYQQVVWVYRAVNVLAEQVANIPFVFSRGARGREKLVTSGPLLEFYDHPHPTINRFQYWELRVMWLLLRGECVRIPIFEDGSSFAPPGTRKKLKSILLLDPARFDHIVQNNELVGWRYTAAGIDTPRASQVFLPEEVWFEKLPNPFDFWRGMAPLQAAALASQSDYCAAAFMKGVMENNGDLGLIVRTAGPIEDAEREQIKAELRNRKRRAGTADSPLILWSGAEVTRPTLSSADIQFLENRKFSRSEICAAFGVPEEILITTDNAKYDVMAGSRLNFIENRVAPFCARLEAEERETIKTIDPTATGWFDLDSLPIMQEARRSRLVAAKAGFDMGIPLNDLNRVLDLGFEELPWGDTGYLPTNHQPLGTKSKTRTS